MDRQSKIFLVFGGLEAITLGLIIIFILGGLGNIGRDTQVVLSVLFPVSLLIVEYMIYSKK